MGEKAPGVAIVELIEEHLAAMSEGGVTDIMPQGDGLNQIQVQIQRPTDGAGDAGHQLNVQTPAGNIVIFQQGENLGLVGIAVVIGAVHDPVDILGKAGPPDLPRLVAAAAANCHIVMAGMIRIGAIFLFLLTAILHL